MCIRDHISSYRDNVLLIRTCSGVWTADTVPMPPSCSCTLDCELPWDNVSNWNPSRSRLRSR